MLCHKHHLFLICPRKRGLIFYGVGLGDGYLRFSVTIDCTDLNLQAILSNYGYSLLVYLSFKWALTSPSMYYLPTTTLTFLLYFTISAVNL